jgi:cell fate (sporulation/competence/biofilm development) regulator YlbF (YheA/YmcA/DUF963 family)
MDGVSDGVAGLCENIRETGAYKDYVAAKRDVAANEGLSRKLDRFKKLNFEYRSKARDGFASSPDEERLVSAAYWELMMNPRARTYLESEKELAVIFNSVCDAVGQVCGIEHVF